MMLQVVLPDSKANLIVYMAMNILSEIVIVCVDHCTQSHPEVFIFFIQRPWKLKWKAWYHKSHDKASLCDEFG